MCYGDFRHASVLLKLSHDSPRLTKNAMTFHMTEVRFASSSPRAHKTAAEQASRKRELHATGRGRE